MDPARTIMRSPETMDLSNHPASGDWTALGRSLGAANAPFPPDEEVARVAFAASNMGHFCVLLGNGETRWSETALTRLALEREREHPEASKSLLDLVHPDDLELVCDRLRDAVDELWPFDLDCRLWSAVGEHRWFHIYGSIGRDDDGDPVCLMACLEDISERQRLDSELARSEERYRTLYEERCEIQKALVTASRNAGAAAVARSVLHDVGNVIGGLTLAAENLREQLDQSSMRRLSKLTTYLGDPSSALGEMLAEHPLGPRLAEYVQTIEAALRQEQEQIAIEADRVIRAARDMQVVLNAHRDRAVPAVVLEDHALPELLEDALELVRGYAMERNVTLGLVGDTLGDLRTDRVVFMRILINLLRNAIDAAAVRQGAGRVCLAVQGDGAGLDIRVTDNGPGVPEELRERIFNAGFSTKGERRGLGLHACALLAGELGGNVSLLETSPAGAVFRFRLDQAPQPDGDPPAR